MMRSALVLTALLWTLTVAADTPKPVMDEQVDEQVTVTLLLWQEEEPGIAPYPTRMLVTPDYLRSDDGRADSDYLLFDRKTGQLFNVAHDDQSVLVIDAAPLSPDAGPRPELDIELSAATDAPRIDGRTAQYFRARHQGQLCSQATVVPGLLSDENAMLRVQRAVLAGRQYRDLHKTPEEYRTPCFLAAYVYAIDAPLAAGFPIQESIEGGMKRVLLDYRREQRVPASLFTVPQDYRLERIP